MSYRVAFHWSETTLHPDGHVPAELTIPLRRHEVAMRGTLGPDLHCVALTGTPGIDASCAIHGSHPSCCREVAPGSDICQRARLRHGLPVVTALQVAHAFASKHPPAVPVDAVLLPSFMAPAGLPESDSQIVQAPASIAGPMAPILKTGLEPPEEPSGVH